MRKVLSIHSFWLSAHLDIDKSELETSLTDLDTETIESEVIMNENVLNPAMIRYLFVAMNSLGRIFRGVYFSDNT